MSSGTISTSAIGGDRALLESGTERLDERLRVRPDVADLAGRRFERRRCADEERALLDGEVDRYDVRGLGYLVGVDQGEGGVRVIAGDGQHLLV